MTKPRPPKKNMTEAITTLAREVARCRDAAVKHQTLADNPIRDGTDTDYWRKSALALTRKADRLETVVVWLNAVLERKP